MNDYEDIARLFAEADQPQPDDTFLAAVSARIDRERRRTKLLAGVSSLGLAVLLVLALLVAPLDWLLPLRFLQTFLTSLTGVVVAAVCAVAMTAGLRIEDVL